MDVLKMSENQLDAANKRLGDLTRLALELVDSPAENEKRKFLAIDKFRQYQAFVAVGFTEAHALELCKS